MVEHHPQDIHSPPKQKLILENYLNPINIKFMFNIL